MTVGPVPQAYDVAIDAILFNGLDLIYFIIIIITLLNILNKV